MNEVKIAPCPYCGKAPKESGNIKTIFSVICNTSGCLLRPYAFSLSDWNDLCADIAKGREVNAVDRIVDDVLQEVNSEVEQHLNTAVGLLGEPESKDIILAARWRIAISDFLALDAIKAILKQKGQ